MCGIFAVFNHNGDMSQFRQKAIQLSKRIRHRGPDWSGIEIINQHVLCHERLAIVGVDSGAQPLKNGGLVLCVNGEIYNYLELRKHLKEKRVKEGKPEPVFMTGSDCEIILHLYEEYGVECVKYLDGMFAFVLYDAHQDRYIAARDPIGIITLYQGYAKDGSCWFASELKCLFEDCGKVFAFEPGTLYDSQTGRAERWFQPVWFDEQYQPPSSQSLLKLLPDPTNQDPFPLQQLKGKIEIDQQTLRKVRECLERAVEKELMSEVPYGVLLSGGLDSSLIASIAARLTAKHAKLEMQSPHTTPSTQHPLWSPRLHSFSVGLPNSPDLKAAKRVAEYIGTIHHEFTFTVQEGLDALRDVIYHLETYDVTTIRASTPMYLMSRKIKATGVKMVLSGEGSDELFGGYLYFHQSPSPKALHSETVKRVRLLHTSDCLRANKSTMAFGLEARVPFLDLDFVELVMGMPAEYKHPQLTKRGIEKELLRSAFDVEEVDGFGNRKGFLPEDILWRQKEQFSDGVGYNWIDQLKNHTSQSIPDSLFQKRHQLYPYNTPDTKEAFYYRQIFEELYCPAAVFKGTDEKMEVLGTVVRWVPREDWGCDSDPSGRAQRVHCEGYQK